MDLMSYFPIKSAFVSMSNIFKFSDDDIFAATEITCPTLSLVLLASRTPVMLTVTLYYIVKAISKPR